MRIKIVANDIIVADPILGKEKKQPVCNVCGRVLSHVTRSGGMYWCTKHYHQFKKYGHAIDTNPRTSNDLNEIRVDSIRPEIAYVMLYNRNNEVIDCAAIDSADIDLVKNYKWRRGGSSDGGGYAMSGGKHMSHLIIGAKDGEIVDHINHNTMDNRRENLRIVTKSQNAMNQNVLGISRGKSGVYYAHIKKNQIMVVIGTYKTRDEALLARWYAEQELFGEYAFKKEKPTVSPECEQAIIQDVNTAIERWQQRVNNKQNKQGEDE